MTLTYDQVRRFGVIAPSVNTVLEPELYGVQLATATFHFVRVRSERGSDEAILRRMAAEAPTAAEQLQDVRPEKIVYACTSGSLVGGPGYDEELARAIADRTGVPATTTATAVINALRSLGAKRVGIGTPYLEWVTQAEVDFFTAAGITVLATASLGLTDGHRMAALTPGEVAALARRADHPDAQAVFLSCTDLPTFGVIASLEVELGKPVVTSNLATLWALVEPRKDLEGLGRLMSTPASKEE